MAESAWFRIFSVGNGPSMVRSTKSSSELNMKKN